MVCMVHGLTFSSDILSLYVMILDWMAALFPELEVTVLQYAGDGFLLGRDQFVKAGFLRHDRLSIEVQHVHGIEKNNILV